MYVLKIFVENKWDLTHSEASQLARKKSPSPPVYYVLKFRSLAFGLERFSL